MTFASCVQYHEDAFSFVSPTDEEEEDDVVARVELLVRCGTQGCRRECEKA
jgi:hypothetical protein